MKVAPSLHRRPRYTNPWLSWSGIAAVMGAALHIAILIGGPDWYAFFGAPIGIVEMARAGDPYAPVSCLVISTILLVFAAYAFSGAGIVRRLPLLHNVLALIAGVLILRGVLFIPLIVWRPGALAGVCDCRQIDAFTVVTSVICLTMGMGYAIGTFHAVRIKRVERDIR